MSAIYKREMRVYFTSPIGYIFIAIFYAVNGALFSYFTLQNGENSNVASYFVTLLYVFIIVIPLLTMKLFSEEKKLRTEQLLLSAPVSLSSMVCAKFFAAYTMFAGTFLVSSLTGFLALYQYGKPNTAVLVGNVLGILLIGGAFIAIGVFLSSLTENQLVSAISTIAVIAALLFLSYFNQYIGSSAVRTVLNWFSIFSRFADFSYGILNINSLLYYASVMFVFLFLTVRVYERKRWE